jgi:peptidylprolyl isomerase
MLFSLLLALACSPNADVATPTAGGSAAAPAGGGPSSVAGIAEQADPSGLKSWVLRAGTGASPQAGQQVEVHYTGWLKSNGKKFDSSLDRGTPFTFRLGYGEVIPGWDQGVAKMKVGEKRQFEIPASLAYGDGGAGGVIPPGATLIFDVELLAAQ